MSQIPWTEEDECKPTDENIKKGCCLSFNPTSTNFQEPLLVWNRIIEDSPIIKQEQEAIKVEVEEAEEQVEESLSQVKETHG